MCGRLRGIFPRVIRIGNWWPPRRAPRLGSGFGCVAVVCRFLIIGLVLALPLGAAGSERFELPEAAIEPVEWSDLDGWTSDDHAAALHALLTSCSPIRAAGPS